MFDNDLNTLSAVVDECIIHARDGIANGENIPPALFLLRIDAEGAVADVELIHPGPFMNSERGKNAFASAMDAALETEGSPINALIYVSEAWAASCEVDKDDPDRAAKIEAARAVPPSQNPDRTEVLLVNVRTKGLDAPAAVARIFDIDREAKTMTERVMEGMTFGGRFMGADAPDPEA